MAGSAVARDCLDLGRGGRPHRTRRACVLVGGHEGRPVAVAGARRPRGRPGTEALLPRRHPRERRAGREPELPVREPADRAGDPAGHVPYRLPQGALEGGKPHLRAERPYARIGGPRELRAAGHDLPDHARSLCQWRPVERHGEGHTRRTQPDRAARPAWRRPARHLEPPRLPGGHGVHAALAEPHTGEQPARGHVPRLRDHRLLQGGPAFRHQREFSPARRRRSPARRRHDHGHGPEPLRLAALVDAGPAEPRLVQQRQPVRRDDARARDPAGHPRRSR